jgi:hypothetical protein
MTTRHKRSQRDVPTRESAVWIDDDRAIVVHGGPDDLPIVDVLTRGPSEAESRFEIRTVDRVLDAPRVVVSGPSASRLEFERRYVALTHRPDRLADDDRTTPLDPAAPAS